MKKHRINFVALLVFLSGTFQGVLYAITYGSNTAPSRQAQPFFPVTDSDNKMLGFGAFENGFFLEDSLTTCTFASFFPVSRDVNLGGGRLNLTNDLVFSNTLNFYNASGVIQGNFLSVEFPKTVSDFLLPSSGSAGSFSMRQVAQTSVVGLPSVNSVDWKKGGKYIGVAVTRNAGNLFYIYYFDGSTLTSTFAVTPPSAQVLPTEVAASVRWSPSGDHVAFAVEGIVLETVVYYHNVSNGTLVVTGSADIGAGIYDTSALAWHPSGRAVAGSGNNPGKELIIYSFDPNAVSDALIETSFLNFTPDQVISRDALSWSPGGNFLVAGLASDATVGANELRVFSFNGILTSSIEVNLDQTVTAVDWSPSGTFIAVGLSTGSELLRIYKHNVAAGTLTENIASRVGETNSVLSMHWDSSGNYLLVGLNTTSGSEFRVYLFDKTTAKLTRLYRSSSAVGSDINSVRWSKEQNYVSRGDAGGGVAVFALTSFDSSFLRFENTHVAFNSDSILTLPVHFHGACTINGRGNSITLGAGCEFLVRPGGSLIIENTELENLGNTNLRCLADNSLITLRNCILSLGKNYTFSRGAFLFDEEVMITGTNNFNYTSGVTSTISSFANLFIDNGITFSYAPRRPNKNLIFMTDKTSKMYLNGCTLYSTVTGLRLAQGMLFVDNKVTLTSEGRNTGEACELSSDLTINVMSGAFLNVYGQLKYN